MSYDRACELLGYTTPKSLEANAELAKVRLSVMRNPKLKELVACSVLINAAK